MDAHGCVALQASPSRLGRPLGKQIRAPFLRTPKRAAATQRASAGHAGSHASASRAHPRCTAEPTLAQRASKDVSRSRAEYVARSL